MTKENVPFFRQILDESRAGWANRRSLGPIIILVDEFVLVCHVPDVSEEVEPQDALVWVHAGVGEDVLGGLELVA